MASPISCVVFETKDKRGGGVYASVCTYIDMHVSVYMYACGGRYAIVLYLAFYSNLHTSVIRGVLFSPSLRNVSLKCSA